MLPFVPSMYNFLQPYLGYLMIIVVVYMILKEKKIDKILWASFVFFISGVLGIIVLGLPNLSQPLLPMLSGLFGISTLITSLWQNVKIPEQKITETIHISFGKKVKAIVAAVISGSFAGFMPGLGSAQAAILAMQFIGDIGDYAFLILVGGINTVNFTFSLATLYTLQKARNGAVVAILEILKRINFEQLAANARVDWKLVNNKGKTVYPTSASGNTFEIISNTKLGAATTAYYPLGGLSTENFRIEFDYTNGDTTNTVKIKNCRISGEVN